MKSNINKEETDTKKKYVFFTDPDVIVRRAESSAAASQALQSFKINEQLRQSNPNVNQSEAEGFSNLQTKSDIKGLETLLTYHPVQPYPFTFITAVKRKLALNMHAEACKRAYEPENLDKPQTDRGANNTNTDFKRSINQVVQKMDFIKPLKVPDLKISPKTLDYSFQTAGGFGNKKFDIHGLDEQVSPACNKLPKSAEKVHRKLDFSVLEGSQSKNCENIEPLKIPDLSIGSSSTKKKEHIRDSSREKENRSKRIKKDDLALARQDDSLKETPRRSKLSKHVSRKDAEESADSVSEMLRSENFLSSLPRESDFALKKPKSKNFITSTVKKSDDKKHRSVSMQALRSSRERSSETKTKNSENDSSSENNMKIHERITLRDNFKGKSTENLNDVKYKNPELLNCKQQKHATKLPSQGQPKQLENHPKSQIRQSYEKQKPSNTEMEFEDMNILDVSEEIKSACASSSKETEKQCRKDSSSKTDDIMRNETSLQQSKSSETSREAEQSDHSCQISTQMEKHHENSGNASSTDKFSSQSLNVDSKLAENPINQVDSSTTSSQSRLNSEYINPQSKSFSEIILDPTRISFRDESYGEQNEFCDLVTPDINLLLRSKRRKNFSHKSDSENDLRSPKHKPANNVQAEVNGIQLAGRDTIDAERHQENQSKADQETIEKTGDLPPHHINETNDPNVEVMNTSNENPNTKSVRTPGRVKHSQDKTLADSDNFLKKNDRTSVRVTEVQTQTANDIATQTDTHRVRRRYISPARQIPGITYERETSDIEEIPQLSFESLNQFEDFDQIENVSLPSRMHTMSEISLHETTSSIKTETGTEISISTRDVTCSFNKYLDSELAQLIKDEKQRFDEIEMLFKSREKTLNDRTKKLVKLEEQKRALRDMGQDSRISSVKKKQRALLLKLQQEKDEMNRLKELHKKASQERKLMLQKQRNMLNPQMSTKNILTKLKRSADNQSPRRLSGPMKGYDIRSPSSMSSLLDSDKSQLDRSHMEMKSHGAEGKLHKYEGKMPRSDIASSQEGQDTRLIKADQFDNMTEPSDTSFIDCNILSPDSQKFLAKEQKIHSAAQTSDAKLKYETKPCKYKEVMPKLDILHHKLHGTDIESNISSKKLSKQDILTGLEKPKVKELQPKSVLNELDKSICDNVKSESDTLVDEVSKKSKSSQATEINFENLKLKREKELLYQKNPFVSENLNTESDDIAEELGSRQSKSSHIVEDISEMTSKSSKKTQNTSMISKESSKKLQNSSKIKSNSKRKGSRSLKSKSSSDILSENIMRSKSSSQIPEEIMKYHSKRSKMEKDEAQSEEDFENLLTDLEANESQSSLHALVKHSKAVKEKNYQILKNIANEHEAKENVPSKDSENMRSISGRQDGNFQNVGNMSTRSQVSTLTISHHSSGESEKSYSRSVVIRAQDHHFRTSKKLDQILSAREAALASRRSCVEKWIAWHSRLRAEENRVTRMEEAMIKLVSGTHNAVSYHDTTISSDTSDVESRIEMLAEKLAERRTEMTRLKREAKRQAKQRLKALETNLLNQIKKYDTTIHEMRKKLENKRGAVANDGLSDKLAIESKSLTDFKIPEIPIKRIKEIYKNSDLLKSRSESEIRGLMSDDNQHKDLEMYGSENSKRISSYKKSPRSATSDVTDRSEMISAKRKAETENIKSIFEDVKSTASKEPDITSDYIGNQSISEQIEESNRASNLRSSSERSIDEISIVSSQCKSDSSRKELQLPRHKEIRNEGITSGASRASSNREPDSIPESIETTTSLQEVQSKPVETVTDVEYSRCYSISIQPSISKDIPTEILSDLEKRNHRSIVECNSSPHAISDGETISDYMLEEISQRDDKNVCISESQQLISSTRILTKITDSEVRSDTSPSEVHLIKNSSIDNVTDGLISVTSRSSSGQNAPQIILDEALTTKGRSDIDEDVLEESVQESESISNKLSFLELGNKNLNDDISTLENDLKALSEMMSQFSKSSDNKSKSDKEEQVVGVLVNDSDKGTSTDVTDLDHPNNFSDQELMFNSNKNATYIVDEERENVDFNEKDLNAQVSEIMQKIVPEDTALRTYSEQEIDFKARSREILNEIEKSIISDHVKSPDRVDINTKSIEINASFEENKDAEAINHLNSLKNDIMSIAEIISNSSEAKKDFTLSGSLECDNLLEDADAIEACSNSHPHAFEEPVVLEQFVEKESLEKPASKMPDECNLKEDSFQTSNETNRPVHSLNDNIEIVSSKNITETPPPELLETNFEHSDQKSTFETIKDPEYEDISEENLEVSEIMDKSEQQRSERELYQKSSRLPEKYQMTQKSEDVLRILDEITQKTNQASQKSQQFLITPENNGKKIGELLQKSEQLCKNFQALTSIPRRSDAGFELPITESHIPNKRLILQTKVTSEQPEQILNESGFPQQIDIPEKTNQTAHEQKTEYVSHDIEIEISSIPSDKPETSSSVAVESHSTKSLDELETGQIRNKEDPDKFGTCQTKFTRESTKLDISMHQTDIQHQNDKESVVETRMFIGNLVDTYNPIERLKIPCQHDESQIFDTKISADIGLPDADVKSYKAQGYSTKEESTQQIQEESVDTASQKFDNLSDKSIKSVEIPEQISLIGETRILSESSEYDIISHQSNLGSANEQLKQNLIITKLSEDTGLGDDNDDKGKSYEELKKVKHLGNINVHVHTIEESSLIPLFGKSSLENVENKVDTLKLKHSDEQEPQMTVEALANLENQCDEILQESFDKLDETRESNLQLQAINEPIHGLHAGFENSEKSQNSADLLPELIHSEKSRDILYKSDVADKSDCASQKSDESQVSGKSEDNLQKYEVELPSESSEEAETPRSVSEIEIDSPRDPNDSRLDIEALDDDLLANENNSETKNIKLKNEFNATPVIATSEKDIEAMIDKLKVSLEQPGLEVAELEAKLLRIQELQIELEIKKLEAEEVSYYVREIPNKPPPPYTPPSGGRLSVSQTSPSPAPAVVPTNVEDLTSFTERATHLIYQAKKSGDDIISLQPPTEICELSKDNNETARRDRKIYNTFLFDLCKETISEVYQSECEKPGPSWLKPNAKTKPAMKIPTTVEGLNDYVSKEVATLFGFKTKLQRENLVMRWSRKRRDRVDELLAREAQAEEDEWTKFHHDELAVKNELTTAILDSLILDAANVVKMAYIKKRQVTS